MLAMVSATRATPAWGVHESPHSLVAQSTASEKHRQSDGWGIAWFRGLRAQWLKSPKPVHDEAEVVKRTTIDAVSRFSIAHIRDASNPLKLDKQKLLSLENTQPFAFQNYVFAHNGTLNIPKEVLATLGPWKRRMQGVNDSEVLFWLLMSYIEEGRPFPTAFAATVSHIWRVWEKLDRKSGEPYTGLNVVFSDGKSSYGACHFLSYPTPPRNALCTENWPFWQMCFRPEKGRVWIASEPLDKKPGWRTLAPNDYIRATFDKDRIRWNIGRLAVPSLPA